jgi:hypothetical protein
VIRHKPCVSDEQLLYTPVSDQRIWRFAVKALRTVTRDLVVRSKRR